MYTQDPRTAYVPFQTVAPNGQNVYAAGYTNPYTQSFQNIYGQPFGIQAGCLPTHLTSSPTHLTGFVSPEISHIVARVEEIRTQLFGLTELLRSDLLRRTTAEVYGQANVVPTSISGLPYGYGLNPLQRPMSTMGYDVSPLRLRESDSHIFWELYLPQLNMGDVDVEVSGNRIICRTRVPVSPTNRWWITTHIPRGFELFELADGRVEFNWLATIAFQAKEVEATWREGFLCVCIPKTEVSPKHTVKVVKDNASGKRTASEMNS